MKRPWAAYACDVRHVNSDRVGAVLVMAVGGAFFAGLLVALFVLPDPAHGPAPPGARIAYYALFVLFLIALASIPLGMWPVDWSAGRRRALAWRVVTAAGVAVAMLAVGWGCGHRRPRRTTCSSVSPNTVATATAASRGSSARAAG